MEPLIELKGTNGIMYIYEDKIVISRKTFGGMAAFGLVGDKTYYYSSIQGIEYSGGMMRIITKGNDTNMSYNNASYSDIRKAQKDSDTLLLSWSKKEIAQKAHEYITNKVNSIYANNNIQNNLSQADEIIKFKKLLDEGIITQEEFERKKQELLK